MKKFNFRNSVSEFSSNGINADNPLKQIEKADLNLKKYLVIKKGLTSYRAPYLLKKLRSVLVNFCLLISVQ